MYSVGCLSIIYVGGCVFPTFVIQNLWVCSVVSLQEMHSVGCCNQYMCVELCVSYLGNPESVGLHNSLPAKMCCKK